MRSESTHILILCTLLMLTPYAGAQIAYAPTQTGGPLINSAALPSATADDSYDATVEVSGATPPYRFKASGLPAGLSIDPSSGRISGEPRPSAVGVSKVTVTVTDSSTPVRSSQTTLTLGVVASAATEICGGLSLGNNASLNGFVPFLPTDAWVTDIYTAHLDPNSSKIIAGFSTSRLHHDWSTPADGNYGIPYVVVDSSTQPLVPISVTDYASESDVAMAPFPTNAPIEGAPADCSGWPNTYLGDAHVAVIDRKTCMLYETFNTHRCNGKWSASSETIWDLTQFEKRPYGWTSADAAGLPIMPGLVRYDEVASGQIRHAIRFTLAHTRSDANGGYFVQPAAHAAGNNSSAYNVMGMRIRLKAGFDISKFSKTNQVILTAMKRYGMILADNGSNLYFQGAPDSRWNDSDLAQLGTIAGSNFEVVQTTPAWPGWDSATAPKGATPVILSFTASATTITKGTSVTLAWNTSGDSYNFIDKLGGVPGTSIAVRPSASTTYTLYATNQSGRTKKSLTVTVK
jgi:Putative Ig domain